MDNSGPERELNDLAVKALQGLDAARRFVQSRPMPFLGVAGFAVSAVVVAAGGRVGAARSTRALTTWLGLQDPHGLTAADRLPGGIMLAAVVVLVLLWILALEVIRRTRQRVSRVWWLTGAWVMPFALGPPLMDTAVYTHAAFGLIQRAGHDPYVRAPSSLHDVPIVAAIDPGSRGVPSSAGPLGSLLQHLSISVGNGSALSAVIILRVAGVLAAIVIGRLAVDMGGSRGGEALAACALNPLVLLYVVSSPHLDGLMVAVALGAIASATQRRWVSAMVLACVAGSITAQGFVLVPILVVAHVLGRRTMPAWRLVGRDVAIAVVVTAGAGLVQPGGFGWAWTVSKQFAVHTPFAIASAIGQVLAPVVRGASYDDLAASGRITAVTAAVCTIVYLVVTVRHRALERTVGYSLLALGLLAPSLYPWYLLWGVLCLAPTAIGTRRVWVVALSAGACVLMPGGFSNRAAEGITGVALGVIALVTAAVLYGVHRRVVLAEKAEPQPVSAES
ncbi:MAG: hypothetical protein M3Y06_00650 [Actinomycetota bacterium]|nr:hypothetical protein [Actinomycetota bacterium]